MLVIRQFLVLFQFLHFARVDLLRKRTLVVQVKTRKIKNNPRKIFTRYLKIILFMILWICGLEKILNAQMFCLKTILSETKSQHSSNPLRQDICNVCKMVLECYKDIEHEDKVDTSKLKKKVTAVSAEVMRIDTQYSTTGNQDFLQSDPHWKGTHINQIMRCQHRNRQLITHTSK